MKVDSTIDYYSVLGITPSASEDEIRKAYHKQVKLHHPDRNIGREEEAKARFTNVQDAYDILSNKTTRDKYDHDRQRRGNGALWERPQPQPQPQPAAPPPDRRPGPGPRPMRATSAYQYHAAAGRGSRSATASRYADFAKSAYDSYQTPDANSSFETFKGFQNVRGGFRPSYPQSSPPKQHQPPPQPPRPPPTAQRPHRTRSDWDEAPSPGRPPPGLGRSQSTRTPRRGAGFDPYAPAGDEPGSRRTSAYYNSTRSDRASTAESKFRPSPQDESRSRPQSAAHVPRPSLADERADAYSSDRLSTPYAAKSGERTYFSSQGMGKPVQSSGNLEGLGTRTSRRSPGSGRFRSASPNARSPKPPEDCTSSSGDDDEIYTDRMKQSQQNYHQRRVSADHRPQKPKVTIEDEADVGPDAPAFGNRAQTWNSQDQSSPIFRQHRQSQSNSHRPYEPAEASQLRSHHAPPQTGSGSVPIPNSTTATYGSSESVNRASNATSDKPPPSNRPPLYGQSIPLPRAPPGPTLPRKNTTFHDDMPPKRQSWPYWAIPSSLGPVGVGSSSEPYPERTVPRGQTFVSSNLHDPYANKTFSRDRFSMPSSSSSSASPSKRPSAEDIDVQFGTPGWQGPFTGTPDQTTFRSDAAASRVRGSPPKRPGLQPVRSTPPPNGPVSKADAASQQMPPPPPPAPPAQSGDQAAGAAQNQPTSPSFRSDEWNRTFIKESNWVSSGPPRNFQIPRSRNPRGAPPRRMSHGVPTNITSGGEDTGNDGDDESRQSGNNDTDGDMSRTASVNQGTAMDIDEASPASTTRNTSAPPAAQTASSTTSPTPGTAFPRPPEPQIGLSMQNLRNVYPLGSPSAGGLSGMKSDLGSTLPFESGTGRAAGMIPRPRALELPQPPKPPMKPGHFTMTSCEFYMKQVASYMREYQKFNGRMLEHFNARQAAAVAMTENSTAAAEKGFLPMCNGIGGSGPAIAGVMAELARWSWMGAQGDDGYLKYLAWMKEDDQVESHWSVARDIHRRTLEDLGKVRKIMKSLASAK